MFRNHNALINSPKTIKRIIKRIKSFFIPGPWECLVIKFFTIAGTAWGLVLWAALWFIAGTI